MVSGAAMLPSLQAAPGPSPAVKAEAIPPLQLGTASLTYDSAYCGHQRLPPSRHGAAGCRDRACCRCFPCLCSTGVGSLPGLVTAKAPADFCGWSPRGFLRSEWRPKYRAVVHKGNAAPRIDLQSWLFVFLPTQPSGAAIWRRLLRPPVADIFQHLAQL